MADQKKVKTKLLIDPIELKYFYEIFGDYNRYEQMLLNFISNAIKFTKPGSQVEVILQAHCLNYPLKKEEISSGDDNLVKAIEEFKKMKFSNESSSEFLYTVKDNDGSVAHSIKE